MTVGATCTIFSNRAARKISRVTEPEQYYNTAKHSVNRDRYRDRDSCIDTGKYLDAIDVATYQMEHFTK